jgi:hypothetical protein
MLAERTVVLLDLPTRTALDDVVRGIQQYNRHMRNATLIRMAVKYCLANPSVLQAVLDHGDPMSPSAQETDDE